MEDKYKEMKDEVYRTLANNRTIVLATCVNNYVTSRTISYVFINNKLYFQTLSSYLKAEQIRLNSNISLCLDNLQIEGIAKIIGYTKDSSTKFFLDKYKVIHKSAYEKYSNLANEIIVEIEIKKISKWCYKNNIGFKEIIDLEKEEFICQN